ncbi:MAG: hypothetical protein HYZ15_13005 [Sphingobacteriales bacterium]|nr:hypothetical protein [Sphingobacteriales bacterium]
MTTENIELIIGLAYFFAAFFIAFVADNRGHSFGAAFFASLITTPLIAAILYAPYAPEKKPEPNNYTAPDVKDPNWTPEQIKLKKQYETGELTVEEYQKRWNETIK